MLLALLDLLPKSSNTEWICLRALKESTILANDIVHSILGSSVEF